MVFLSFFLLFFLSFILFGSSMSSIIADINQLLIATFLDLFSAQLFIKGRYAGLKQKVRDVVVSIQPRLLVQRLDVLFFCFLGCCLLGRVG